MKNLTLKTALALTVIALAAPSFSQEAAYAGTRTQDWRGNAGTFGTEGCSFIGGQNSGQSVGEMSRRTGESDHIWETTRKATKTVFSRGVSEISVTAGNRLYTSEGIVVPNVDIAMDYSATETQSTTLSSISITSGNATVGNTTLSVANLSSNGVSKTDFYIGGTATMTVSESAPQALKDAVNNHSDGISNVLNSNSIYKIVHTMTCTQ